MLNQFTISQRPISISSDIRFNIVKRKQIVKYQTNTSNKFVNLGFVINPELKSDNSIFIDDRSDELAANRIPEQIFPTIFHGKTISLPIDKFIATDIFMPTIENVPLFFKHVLKNFDNGTIHDIKIRDQNFGIVSEENIIFDKTQGVIYSNLENSQNVFYYVVYSIRDNTSNISSFTELLDNEPIFNLATLDDLNTDGNLDRTKKIYLINELSSNLFEIEFPISSLYAIKEESFAKIKLLRTDFIDNNNPWFVSVTNGNFFTTLYTAPSNPVILNYNIPEFGTQLFNPEFPFKFKDKEVAIQVDNKVLETLKKNIDPTKYIEVVLRNPDNTVRFAFTTNPNKIGTPFEGVLLYENGIRSIDRKTGLIDLIVPILDTDIIEVSYFYIEDQFEIIDINFNPIENASILGKQIVYYIVPNSNRSKTLFYLIVNQKGIIELGNQVDNLSLITDINSGHFPYDDGSNLSFVEKYTVQASTPYSNSFKYFILGGILISNSFSVNNTGLFDVRKHGGGLEKNRLKELAQLDPEVMFCTDSSNWDGIPYPGNGSTMIEIPSSLLKINGGTFEASDIIQVVERHIGLGIYPIIKGYGIDINPTIEVYG
jgi:hypothetical protein